MIHPCDKPLVLVFFNLDLREGPKPKSLRSAGTNPKKKMQGPMSKSDKNGGTNAYLRRKKTIA